jgi:hypothetical protein
MLDLVLLAAGIALVRYVAARRRFLKQFDGVPSPRGWAGPPPKDDAMTSEQAIRLLTPAQRRIFTELQEPSRTGYWCYRSRREQRSADALVSLGYVECVERSAQGNAYRLSDLGKLLVGPLVFTPEKQAAKEKP